MKRKYVISVLFILFFSVIAFALVYALRPDFLFGTEEEEVETIRPTLYMYIYGDELVYSFSVEANAISGSDDIYLENTLLDYVYRDNFELVAKVGTEFKSGDVIYNYRGKEYSYDFDGLLVDVSYNKIEGNYYDINLTLLNFDNVYLQCYVTTDNRKQISYDSDVEVIVDGETIKGKVSYIDYEIKDGKILVQVEVDKIIYPGTAAEVKFITGKSDYSLLIHEVCVYFDGYEYYTYRVLKDENGNEYYEKQNIKVGNLFTQTNDDVTISFYELLSGLEEGDYICTFKHMESNIAQYYQEELVEKIENYGR